MARGSSPHAEDTAGREPGRRHGMPGRGRRASEYTRGAWTGSGWTEGRRFEGPDPSASVRLFEAEKTPDLAAYIDSITDVTNFVNRTFSLFKTARERRPEKLVQPKA